MKKMLVVYFLLIGAFLVYVFQYYAKDPQAGIWKEEGLHGEIGENYVMVTFQSGLEYWKSCLKGFEDAGDALNVSVEYRGATQYDVREQITVLEQIIAKKPAGIAVSSIDPYALTPTIDRAAEAGIPVVLFDSGAPGSKAYSLLATNNYNAGAAAAEKMAQLAGRQGEVAVITLPGQQNHQDRVRGFRETIKNNYPAMKVVAVADGKGDSMASKNVTLSIMKAHPKLAGVFVTEATGGIGVGEAAKSIKRSVPLQIISFDTNKGTLDMIKEGTIAATLAQGTWNMGYWSLQYLFHLHHGLTIPAPSKIGDVSPLPVQVDTGVSVVTKDNVENYYAK
ncbi:sugar ABC transporter substrate-binding protein [Paenibacillus zeisoli]|uniref:Sugar ABC transporter substrate-binding protein n=1 Tax=Paenibacillus zeisoli TaxID=2496267 RepID=A0A433XNE5_9BACL|nr:substrate-binding domain-containing protein [Paenibacillus zeisoli]RUT35605.1 sugar ABC transporter substrate-binding protein [Paenibacillus zeisoli]